MPATEIPTHPLITAKEVAAALNIGQRTLWRMLSKAKGGPSCFPRPVRIGRNVVRWRWEDVARFIEESSRK